MPNYLKTNFGTWKIDDGPDGTWILKRLTTLRWKPTGIYKTEQEAADAVATGTTNEPDWDKLPHNPALSDLSMWVEDKTGKWPE
jgi:hypothetical protein